MRPHTIFSHSLRPKHSLFYYMCFLFFIVFANALTYHRFPGDDLPEGGNNITTLSYKLNNDYVMPKENSSLYIHWYSLSNILQLSPRVVNGVIVTKDLSNDTILEELQELDGIPVVNITESEIGCVQCTATSPITQLRVEGIDAGSLYENEGDGPPRTALLPVPSEVYDTVIKGFVLVISGNKLRRCQLVVRGVFPLNTSITIEGNKHAIQTSLFLYHQPIDYLIVVSDIVLAQSFLTLRRNVFEKLDADAVPGVNTTENCTMELQGSKLFGPPTSLELLGRFGKPEWRIDDSALGNFGGLDDTARSGTRRPNSLFGAILFTGRAVVAVNSTIEVQENTFRVAHITPDLPRVCDRYGSEYVHATVAVALSANSNKTVSSCSRFWNGIVMNNHASFIIENNTVNLAARSFPVKPLNTIYLGLVKRYTMVGIFFDVRDDTSTGIFIAGSSRLRVQNNIMQVYGMNMFTLEIEHLPQNGGQNVPPFYAVPTSLFFSAPLRVPGVSSMAAYGICVNRSDYTVQSNDVQLLHGLTVRSALNSTFPDLHLDNLNRWIWAKTIFPFEPYEDTVVPLAIWIRAVEMTGIAHLDVLSASIGTNISGPFYNRLTIGAQFVVSSNTLTMSDNGVDSNTNIVSHSLLRLVILGNVTSECQFSDVSVLTPTMASLTSDTNDFTNYYAHDCFSVVSLNKNNVSILPRTNATDTFAAPRNLALLVGVGVIIGGNITLRSTTVANNNVNNIPPAVASAVLSMDGNTIDGVSQLVTFTGLTNGRKERITHCTFIGLFVGGSVVVASEASAEAADGASFLIEGKAQLSLSSNTLRVQRHMLDDSPRENGGASLKSTLYTVGLLVFHVKEAMTLNSTTLPNSAASFKIERNVFLDVFYSRQQHKNVLLSAAGIVVQILGRAVLATDDTQSMFSGAVHQVEEALTDAQKEGWLRESRNSVRIIGIKATMRISHNMLNMRHESELLPSIPVEGLGIVFYGASTGVALWQGVLAVASNNIKILYNGSFPYAVNIDRDGGSGAMIVQGSVLLEATGVHIIVGTISVIGGDATMTLSHNTIFLQDKVQCLLECGNTYRAAGLRLTAALLVSNAHGHMLLEGNTITIVHSKSVLSESISPFAIITGISVTSYYPGLCVLPPCLETKTDAVRFRFRNTPDRLWLNLTLLLSMYPKEAVVAYNNSEGQATISVRSSSFTDGEYREYTTIDASDPLTNVLRDTYYNSSQGPLPMSNTDVEFSSVSSLFLRNGGVLSISGNTVRGGEYDVKKSRRPMSDGFRGIELVAEGTLERQGNISMTLNTLWCNYSYSNSTDDVFPTRHIAGNLSQKVTPAILVWGNQWRQWDNAIMNVSRNNISFFRHTELNDHNGSITQEEFLLAGEPLGVFFVFERCATEKFSHFHLGDSLFWCPECGPGASFFAYHVNSKILVSDGSSWLVVGNQATLNISFLQPAFDKHTRTYSANGMNVFLKVLTVLSARIAIENNTVFCTPLSFVDAARVMGGVIFLAVGDAAVVEGVVAVAHNTIGVSRSPWTNHILSSTILQFEGISRKPRAVLSVSVQNLTMAGQTQIVINDNSVNTLSLQGHDIAQGILLAIPALPRFLTEVNISILRNHLVVLAEWSDIDSDPSAIIKRCSMATEAAQWCIAGILVWTYNEHIEWSGDGIPRQVFRAFVKDNFISMVVPTSSGTLATTRQTYGILVLQQIPLFTVADVVLARSSIDVYRNSIRLFILPSNYADRFIVNGIFVRLLMKQSLELCVLPSSGTKQTSDYEQQITVTARENTVGSRWISSEQNVAQLLYRELDYFRKRSSYSLAALWRLLKDADGMGSVSSAGLCQTGSMLVLLSQGISIDVITEKFPFTVPTRYVHSDEKERHVRVEVMVTDNQVALCGTRGISLSLIGLRTREIVLEQPEHETPPETTVSSVLSIFLKTFFGATGNKVMLLPSAKNVITNKQLEWQSQFAALLLQCEGFSRDVQETAKCEEEESPQSIIQMDQKVQVNVRGNNLAVELPKENQLKLEYGVEVPLHGHLLFNLVLAALRIELKTTAVSEILILHNGLRVSGAYFYDVSAKLRVPVAPTTSALVALSVFIPVDTPLEFSLEVQSNTIDQASHLVCASPKPPVGVPPEPNCRIDSTVVAAMQVHLFGDHSDILVRRNDITSVGADPQSKVHYYSTGEARAMIALGENVLNLSVSTLENFSTTDDSGSFSSENSTTTTETPETRCPEAVAAGAPRGSSRATVLCDPHFIQRPEWYNSSGLVLEFGSPPYRNISAQQSLLVIQCNEYNGYKNFTRELWPFWLTELGGHMSIREVPCDTPSATQSLTETVTLVFTHTATSSDDVPLTSTETLYTVTPDVSTNSTALSTSISVSGTSSALVCDPFVERSRLGEMVQSFSMAPFFEPVEMNEDVVRTAPLLSSPTEMNKWEGGTTIPLKLFPRVTSASSKLNIYSLILHSWATLLTASEQSSVVWNSASPASNRNSSTSLSVSVNTEGTSILPNRNGANKNPISPRIVISLLPEASNFTSGEPFVATLEVPYTPEYALDTAETLVIEAPLSSLIPLPMCLQTDEQVLGRRVVLLELTLLPRPTAAQLVTREFVTTVTTAAEVLAVVASVGNAAAVDQQTLVVLNMLSCTDPYASSSVASYRALAPLTWEDNFRAVVLANLATILVFFVLHSMGTVIAKKVMKLWKRRREANDIEQHRHFSQHVSWRETIANTRFPAITISLISALYTGTLFAGGQLLVHPQEATSNKPVNSVASMTPGERRSILVLGSFAVVLLLLFPVVLALTAFLCLSRSYTEYRHLADGSYHYEHRRIPNWVIVYIFPRGVIQSMESRRAWSWVISSFVVPPGHYWPTYIFWPPVILFIFSLIQPTVQSCKPYLICLALVFLLLFIFVCITRPRRSGLLNTFDATSKLLQSLITFCMAASLEEDGAAAVRAGYVFSVILTILNIFRIVHSVLFYFIEQHVKHSLSFYSVQCWEYVAPLPCAICSNYDKANEGLPFNTWVSDMNQLSDAPQEMSDKSCEVVENPEMASMNNAPLLPTVDTESDFTVAEEKGHDELQPKPKVVWGGTPDRIPHAPQAPHVVEDIPYNDAEEEAEYQRFKEERLRRLGIVRPLEQESYSMLPAPRTKGTNERRPQGGNNGIADTHWRAAPYALSQLIGVPPVTRGEPVEDVIGSPYRTPSPVQAQSTPRVTWDNSVGLHVNSVENAFSASLRRAGRRAQQRSTTPIPFNDL